MDAGTGLHAPVQDDRSSQGLRTGALACFDAVVVAPAGTIATTGVLIAAGAAVRQHGAALTA